MFDIWGFLLQTLTASGVAVLLLIIKALLKDKLSPKWHFSVWSILGIMILFPAGILGRYALFNWQTVIEFIKILLKNYSFSQVLFPFPIIKTVPHTFAEWLFIVYIAGVIISLLIYLISYIKLRLVLRKGNEPSIELISTVNTIADKHKIKPCKIIVVAGLPSAFVCGAIRPVLVVPENQLDEKIILHELFHLKNNDTFWSIIICFLRCLHWCNPLINHCANLAINDMESRCDQFVLEQLEGEERRDFGLILLSMSNERFAKTPGSTCINNGGKNIRKRIENIARFKLYPVGMSLVSVCVIIVLGCSLVIGVQAVNIPESHNNDYWSMALAKSSYCTTYAGAFDTYAKSIIRESRNYRIMCAPENMQKDLIKSANGRWNGGLDGTCNSGDSYYIYNLKAIDKDIYEGVLVLKLVNRPNGMEYELEKSFFVAYQEIRVYKEKGRWVTIPLEEFHYAETNEEWLHYGCSGLPATTYTGTQKNFKINIIFQTIYVVDNKITNNDDVFSSMFGNSYSYNTVPILNAKFSMAYDNHESTLTHLGTQEERDSVNRIGVSVTSVYPGQERPGDLPPAIGCQNIQSSSSDGSSSSTSSVEQGWGPEVHLSGGGSGGTFSQLLNVNAPGYYVADLYINNELYAQMKLHLEKEE